MTEKQEILTKRFTPEELAELLGFPTGTRVVLTNPVDWLLKWEITADRSKSESTIPIYPITCGTEDSYAKAMRKYARAKLTAIKKGGDKPIPIEPIYRPSTIRYLSIELEKALGEDGGT